MNVELGCRAASSTEPLILHSYAKPPRQVTQTAFKARKIRQPGTL
jgi:hypothetical protein